MTTWSKDELHKIAQADDLHISPFRDDGGHVRYPDLDLVGRGRRRSLRARLERAELSLVSSRSPAEGGADHRGRNGQGGCVRAGGRTDQEPHR